MTDKIGIYSAKLQELEKVADGFTSRFIREGFSSRAWEAIQHPVGDMDSDLRTLIEACLSTYAARLAWDRQKLENDEKRLAETDEALGIRRDKP